MVTDIQSPEKPIKTTLLLYLQQRQLLEAYSARTGCNQSAAVRRAIEAVYQPPVEPEEAR